MEGCPGASALADGRCRFRVWAPAAERVEVLLGDGARTVLLRRAARGYHEEVVADAPAGTRYRVRVDGGEPLPDPASRLQPEGVHGASAVVDPAFAWGDGRWRGVPLRRYVIYELHVGTFTPAGTFDAGAARLPELAALGVTAVELMPVAQFPGERNWGYDGVHPFAVQASYGGPDGLKRFVDAAHAAGLAVVLDVVYNHLGPEGNYLRAFGPYFTDRYRTPWGEAINFDGPDSDEVRAYFVCNALRWLDEFHVDALRLDAVHAIVDVSARPFLAELADAAHDLGEARGRPAYLIAETDMNDPRTLAAVEGGGLGMDAQWSDDVHHALHAVVTGERDGYYADFGEVAALRAALARGFVQVGGWSAHRRRRHGAPPRTGRGERFVVCAQNHDQIGNRMLGERLTALVDPALARLAAAATLLSPFLPLVFMGEEYGETAPFQYFVSHTDPDLVEAVRRGRRDEFAAFAWAGEAPDPQSEETFARSRVDWSRRDGDGRETLALYRDLLALRRDVPALATLDLDATAVGGDGDVVTLHRRAGASEAWVALNFGAEATAPPAPGDGWTARLGSLRPSLAPHAFAVLTREREAA
jgi:maltooligosyltrehalose trehalohydrolase